MQIIITGGAGFIGQRLAVALLKSKMAFDELLLADVVMPATPGQDPRVHCLKVDLSEEGAAETVISPMPGTPVTAHPGAHTRRFPMITTSEYHRAAISKQRMSRFELEAARAHPLAATRPRRWWQARRPPRP